MTRNVLVLCSCAKFNGTYWQGDPTHEKCDGTGTLLVKDPSARPDRCSCPASFYHDNPGTHSEACPRFETKGKAA